MIFLQLKTQQTKYLHEAFSQEYLSLLDSSRHEGLPSKIGHEPALNGTAFIQLTLCYFGSGSQKHQKIFTVQSQTPLKGGSDPRWKSFFGSSGCFLSQRQQLDYPRQCQHPLISL